MILFPKSKYGYRRYSYAPATRRLEAITPSWLQLEAKGNERRGHLDSLIIKAAGGAWGLYLATMDILNGSGME